MHNYEVLERWKTFKSSILLFYTRMLQIALNEIFIGAIDVGTIIDAITTRIVIGARGSK